MFLASHYSRASALPAICLSWLVFWLPLAGLLAIDAVALQAPNDRAVFTGVLDLIYRQKYNEAINQLERLLEKDPANSDALTYMATANLYLDQDFTKAKGDFEAAFKAGGGATFFVTHSHERFSTGEVVDYCRGWLHLRADRVEFVPLEGSHGFKAKYNEVAEFKTSRLSKKVFHIRVGEKNQNFRGRSNSEVEALLIIALYKKFARN
jgi:tetratricopeptide (TPR) repeat protein